MPASAGGLHTRIYANGQRWYEIDGFMRGQFLVSMDVEAPERAVRLRIDMRNLLSRFERTPGGFPYPPLDACIIYGQTWFQCPWRWGSYQAADARSLLSAAMPTISRHRDETFVALHQSAHKGY